jgi:hypothetical protein
MDSSVDLEIEQSTSTFNAIIKKNDELYSSVLEKGAYPAAHKHENELKETIPEIIKEVNSLLKDLKKMAELTRTWDEYQLLSDAIFRWQVVFTSILNIPQKVELPTPQSNLLPPLLESKALTENEIEYLVQRNAKYLEKMALSRDRSLADFGINKDQSSQIYLALHILEGKINLASRISSASYGRLESVWVQDIKKLTAYFLWEERGGGIDKELEKADFIKASDLTRELLANEGIKAQKTEFGEAKAYIEKCFLSSNGRNIDSRKDEVQSLISLKAQKIREETRCNNFRQRWNSAEYFVELFYNNIIPAVIDNSEDSVLAVLKAFQYSQYGNDGRPYHIINAFEAALIIYFVDAKNILALWDKSDKHPRPDSFLESTVRLQYSKDDFKVPTKLENRFNFLEGAISFRGIMTSSEYNSIIQGLSITVYKQALKELFNKSRLIHRETTL